jgi:hypothetical protein
MDNIPLLCVCLQIAGLDIGWHNPVDLEMDPKLHAFILRK